MSGIDLSGVSVTLAMPVRNVHDITVPTTMSLIGTINELHRYGVAFQTNIILGDIITHARSWAVHSFLRADRNRLFFLDSDLVWKAEDFMKLLAYSTVYEVIGAAYRAKRDPPFYLMHLEDGIHADERGCIPVSGMGLGFTCIQRSVLERLSAKAPVRKHTLHKEPFPDVFRFDRIGDEGELRGEDFSFLADVRELGHTPRLDPSITLGHIGDMEFTGRVSDILVAARAAAE